MLEHDINDLIAVVHVAWLLRVSCYGHANNRLIVIDCKLSLFACYLVRTDFSISRFLDFSISDLELLQYI